MKSPLPSQGELAILSLLTREAASEPVPLLDWEGMERELFAELDKSAAAVVRLPDSTPLPKAVPVASSRAGFAVALAAAAMVALTMGVSERPANRGSVAASSDAAGGDAGSVPGLASWTLAPGSRARIVAAPENNEPGRESMTVTLMQGALHAEVVHRDQGESFAVEVGNTRIAAHGTSFDVVVEGDRAVVSVVHGSVAVGPAGHPGSTQGWMLVGPERASFSLDGARDARWLPEPAAMIVASPRTGERAPAAAPASGTRKPNAARDIPAAPLAGAVADAPLPIAAAKAGPGRPSEAPHFGVGAILSGLEECYARQVAAAGVEFSIESTLRLTILPNGTVREGVFDPPLSPTLMSCAIETLGHTRLAAGPKVYHVQVPVRLAPARVAQP